MSARDAGIGGVDVASRNFEIVISVPAGEPLPTEKQIQYALWKGLDSTFLYPHLFGGEEADGITVLEL